MGAMATDEHIEHDHDFDTHHVPVLSPQPGEQEAVQLTAHIGPSGPFVEVVVNGQAALVGLHALVLAVAHIGLETDIDLDAPHA